MGLAVGSKLGRYQVVDQIGAGGMGEVYRAKDTRLGREVAIKILPEAYRSTSRLRRFEIEARAAGALNHPGIVALHDVGEDRGVPYVVTELLEGETLRARLRQGPLPRTEATRVARDILDALTAAHAKNIVHRDLKPENIFLCRDGRTKLLDFGLAKLLERESDPSGDAATAPADTEAGDAMGTPGYMAPEQVRGEPTDRRADLFAFGAVLYEMATGRRAFQRDTAAETAVAVLKDQPPPLDDRVLAAVVAVCLEKDREHRIGSAADLRRLLDEAQAPPRTRRRRRWLAVAAGAIVLAGGVAAAVVLRHDRGITAGHHRVALLGFSGAAAESWRAPLLAASVQGALGEGDELDLVESNDVDELRRDLDVTPADGYDRGTLARVHARSGADYVISGAFDVANETLTLRARVQDASTGETVATAKGSGAAGDLAVIALAAAAPLREMFHAGPMGPDAALHVRATVPAAPEAQQLWGQFQERVARDPAPRADDRPLLEHVVALDSMFAPAHEALSAVYTQGNDQHATAELQAAFSLAGRLADRERVVVEYRYWRGIDASKALARAEARWREHPRCESCGVWLADAYRELNRWSDCLRTTAEVRTRGASTPRLDRIEAQCRWRHDDVITTRGDKDEALAAVHRGIARAREIDARTELGRLCFVEGQIISESGQISDALSAFAEARDLLRAVKALPELRKVLDTTLELLVRTGQVTAAQRVFDEQLALDKELGRYDEGTALRVRGWLLVLEGQYADARALLDQAYVIVTAKGDTLIGRLIRYHQRRYLERRMGDLPGSLALTTEDVGFNRKRRPDQEDFEHAHHVLLVLEDTIDSDHTSEVQPLLDELRPLPIDEDNKLDLELTMSRLALDDGRSADAEKQAREVVAVTEARGLTVELARGRALLARALLAQGKEADALAMATEARNLAERFDNYPERIGVLVVHGFVQGWTSPVLGVPVLERLIDDARQHGDIAAQFEAQLALGRVLMHDGKAAEGRALLDKLQTDARAKGWLRIARLAKTAAS